MLVVLIHVPRSLRSLTCRIFQPAPGTKTSSVHLAMLRKNTCSKSKVKTTPCYALPSSLLQLLYIQAQGFTWPNKIEPPRMRQSPIELSISLRNMRRVRRLEQVDWDNSAPSLYHHQYSNSSSSSSFSKPAMTFCASSIVAGS